MGTANIALSSGNCLCETVEGDDKEEHGEVAQQLPARFGMKLPYPL